ncbi:MAG TPA: hypothetical protein VGN15_07765 [Ktedonobacteraceae bacterium]|jgi:hypothetical protein|nr:hypothetical protein [Ktedonobacteraceae bacterium]
MSTPVDVSDDIRAAKKIRLPWWGVLCIIVGSLPIYLLFDQFGQLDIALPILNFIVILCFIVFVKRKLRRYAWFWITVAVIVAVHIPLFLLFPWTLRWIPALMIVVIDSVDFCLMLWIIAIIGKIVGGADATQLTSPN